MIIIKRFVCNMLQENCYVASDETLECVIIDCGALYPEEGKAIVNYINDNGLLPKHLISTHGHIDHNFGNRIIFEEFGLKPKIHFQDRYLMENLSGQAKEITGNALNQEMPSVDTYLRGTDIIRFGNHFFRIIETPGHTPGSVFFYCDKENIAFSGDTLFYHSIGRTDLEGGSMFQMIQSLRMLCQLPDETKIFPGHGEETTIGRELAENPYLDR